MCNVKGLFSGVIQFLTTESPLKVMKNVFCFTLNHFLFLSYLNFCPDFFGDVVKRLDKKAKIAFKNYGINWETNNYNIHIAQYLRSKNNHTMNFEWSADIHE